MTPAEKLAKAKNRKKKTPWGERTKEKRPTLFATGAKELRTELGLTQTEVAEAIGTTTSSIISAEMGFDMYLSTALKLAAFYGRTVEQIWSLAPTPATTPVEE